MIYTNRHNRLVRWAYFWRHNDCDARYTRRECECYPREVSVFTLLFRALVLTPVQTACMVVLYCIFGIITVTQEYSRVYIDRY